MQNATPNQSNEAIEPTISSQVSNDSGATISVDPSVTDANKPQDCDPVLETDGNQPEKGVEKDGENREAPKSRPKGNFITKYREYADIVEVPADAHEAVAMALLAAVLNRNGVEIMHGAITIPMDLWLILISESGAGRNTLISLATPILKKAGLEDLIRTTAWGSEMALYQNFAENPRGLFVWPELSIVLKKLAQPNFGGAKVWLTDCYDNPNVPDDVTYRKTGKKDTPPIVFSEPPRTNIIATSSEDWLMTNLVQEDTTGGFLPRFLLLKLDGMEKDIPEPRETDLRLKHELVEQLKYVNTYVRGVVTLSKDVRIRYDRWYRETKKRFLAQPNSSLARVFFNRLRNQVLKLAVIHEVAETGTLQVSVASLEKAIATAAKMEEAIFGLLPTGMNREGAELMKIEQRIKEGKVDGVLKSTLTRAFQSTPWRERSQRIQTLCQGGAVVMFQRETNGRTASVYVHKDYAEEHKAKFPDDKS